MKIYKYPYGTTVGEFIYIGDFKNESLVYSLNSKKFPKFFLILKDVMNNLSEIREETENDKYIEDMKIEYLSYKNRFYNPITTLYQTDKIYKKIFEACTVYYCLWKTDEDTTVEKLLSKLTI